MTRSSEPEKATYGKNLSRKELNIVKTKRMKTAPINRDVEVISVTPVTISELETQNETTGIIKLPTIIARMVIVLVLFSMPLAALLQNIVKIVSYYNQKRSNQ